MSRLAALTLLILLLVPAVFAKGKPDLIVLNAPEMKHPIDLKDPAVLGSFNPWGGQFLDWKLGAVNAPACGAEYDVRFFMRWQGRPASPYDRGPLKFIYGVRYCQEKSGDGPGYVFLPGPNDQYGRLNWGTIMRDGYDGKWFRATPAWAAAISHAVAAPGH